MTIIQTLRRRILAPAISAAAIITTLGMASPASAEGYVYTKDDVEKLSAAFLSFATIPESADQALFSTEDLRAAVQTIQSRIGTLSEDERTASPEWLIYAATMLLDKYLSKPLLSASDRQEIDNIIETLYARAGHYADAAGFVCMHYVNKYANDKVDLDNDAIEKMASSCQTAANGASLYIDAYVVLYLKSALGSGYNKIHIQKALMWGEVLKTLYPKYSAETAERLKLAETLIPISDNDRQAAHEMFLACERKGYLNCAE